MKLRLYSGIALSLILLPNALAHAETESGTSESTASYASARGKLVNLETGVNFLGLYRKTSQGDNLSALPNGFSFQEAEIQFSADVDPYFRAVALFSLGEGVSTEAGLENATVFSFEPEEVYFETISVPVVTFKVGQFKTAMGRHNILHTHAFPFIDAPLINQSLLGDEGLSDVGVSASALLPAPWFTEFTIQGIAARSDVLYNSPNKRNTAGVAQLKSLWDLSEDATAELNLFGTLGPNQYNSTSYVYGSDFTIKWRPSTGGKYKSLIWTSEYLNGLISGNNIGGSPGFGPRLGGMASWVQYQFAERWWAQGRVELSGIPRSENATLSQKQSALLAFFPSEFSAFRVQYDHLTSTDLPVDNAVSFQWNISVGAHPAHAY